MNCISHDALRIKVQEGTIATVLAAFPDMQGRLVGKRFNAQTFVDSGFQGWDACNYLLGCDIENTPLEGFKSFNWSKGYGDFSIRPDAETLIVLPWGDRTALIIGDVIVAGAAPCEVAPRTILKKQIQRADALGLKLKVASELEFYLFRNTYEELRKGRIESATPSSSYIQDYDLLCTSREESLLKAIRRHLNDMGIAVEATKGEWGPGQFEINLAPATPLEMADRHVLLKYAVKDLASSSGRAITFMAKWHKDHAGSSNHIHCSLWNNQAESLSWDNDSSDHLSPLMKHWIAGQLQLAPEIAFFFAPYVNSYKRWASFSFAPTGLAVGRDNRTTALRVVGHSPQTIRVENRCPGADSNPYLALAAMIAAGIHGIENKLPFEGFYDGNAYRDHELNRLPLSLNRALQNLEQSQVLRSAFGTEVIDHYVNLGRHEERVYDAYVSDLEVTRNFERS